MAFGVLEFRYDTFSNLLREHQLKGEYTVDLGDNMQSLAVGRIYASQGISPSEILSVNRDRLPSYDGPNVAVVMNASFHRASFPLPLSVRPIFVGFHTYDRFLIEKNLAMFRRNEPIGCRDLATVALFKALSIEAYPTGCLTLTLAK